MTVVGKAAKAKHRWSREYLESRMAISADRELKDLTIVDRRTRVWKLRKQHRDELVAALGGEERLSAHQLLQLEIVLGLSALVSDFQARLAIGEQINSERFIAASKELRRVSAELKLPRDKPASASLRDHIAKRVAAREQEGRAE